MVECRHRLEKERDALPAVAWSFDGKNVGVVHDKSDSLVENFEPHQVRDNKTVRLSSNTRMYEVEDNVYTLDSGCALVTSKEPLQIESCQAKIVTQGKAAFVIHAQNGVLRVLDLCDKKSGAIKVLIGNHYHHLFPGQEALVYRLDHPNPIAAVGADKEVHSRNYEITVDDTHKLTTFDFDYSHALRKCQIYQELSNNSNKSPEQIKTDQKLLNGILKTAAVVTTIRHPNTRPKIPRFFH